MVFLKTISSVIGARIHWVIITGIGKVLTKATPT